VLRGIGTQNSLSFPALARAFFFHHQQHTTQNKDEGSDADRLIRINKRKETT